MMMIQSAAGAAESCVPPLERRDEWGVMMIQSAAGAAEFCVPPLERRDEGGVMMIQSAAGAAESCVPPLERRDEWGPALERRDEWVMLRRSGFVRFAGRGLLILFREGGVGNVFGGR